jgi:hypothetical protein
MTDDKASDTYWRSFPTLEKLLGQERPTLLVQIGATCRRLETILKSGSSPEKARAQDAITAYRRALELYQELVNRRDEFLIQSRNSRKSPHDK